MKSVYKGSEKVAEFDDYSELRVGGSKPAFIYEGNELVYPNPVKDGLVLWYDFSGRTNADSQRGIAEDLSGNGNHGTLQNFNYTAESGYDKNKLLFDGVDDSIDIPKLEPMTEFTLLITAEFSGDEDTMFLTNFDQSAIYLRKWLGTDYHVSSTSVDSGQNSSRVTRVFTKGQDKSAVVGMISDGENNFYQPVFNDEDTNKVELFSIRPAVLMDLGKWGNSGTDPFKGSMYSVKLYNRPLSAEEIAHNYAIEKERFGIE